jgi:hypothetical protein
MVALIALAFAVAELATLAPFVAFGICENKELIMSLKKKNHQLFFENIYKIYIY